MKHEDWVNNVFGYYCINALRKFGKGKGLFSSLNLKPQNDLWKMSAFFPSKYL